MASQIGDLKATPAVADPKVPTSVFQSFRLDGKVAAISGAGAGIGFQVARAYAEAGAHVIIWYNSNDEAITKAADLGKEFNVKTKAMKVNVTDPDAVQSAFDEIMSEFKRLDVFVANSGIPWSAGPLLDAEVKEWHKVVDVDLNGVYYCARAAGLIFREQRQGNLILTASMSGHIANVPNVQACYNACKAAVIHLTKSLAVEFAEFGARVNCVSPGYIGTDISKFAEDDVKQRWRSLTPMHREGRPEELKGAYLFLASDASTFCTGTDLV